MKSVGSCCGGVTLNSASGPKRGGCLHIGYKRRESAGVLTKDRQEAGRITYFLGQVGKRRTAHGPSGSDFSLVHLSRRQLNEGPAEGAEQSKDGANLQTSETILKRVGAGGEEVDGEKSVETGRG